VVRPLAPRGSRKVAVPVLSFRRGIYGGESDLGKPVDHARLADNTIWEPLGAAGVRPGYRDASTGVLPAEPHSLMAWYSSTGDHYFTAAGDKIYRMIDGGGMVLQTLPITPTATGRWKWGNINSALVVQQEGGANPPIFYEGTSWITTVFPVPAVPVLGQTVDGTSAVDAGTHLYRVRWRFRNGSSIAGPTATILVVAGNRVDVTLPTGGAPAPARSDFVGWSIERTKLGDATIFYWVADGTGPTYQDKFSDAALGYLVGNDTAGTPGVHGGAPQIGGKFFEGIITHRERIIGWLGSRLYVSQAVADPVEGSGPFNFHPVLFYLVEGDDGDDIVTANRGGDRLGIFKTASTHVLEGFDPDSFTLRMIDATIGAAGPRCVAAHGGAFIVYHGHGRIFVSKSDQLEPFGQLAIGHYLAKVDVSRDNRAVLWNQDGEYLCMAYGESPDLFNRHVLAYRIPHRTWTHWTEMRVNDALVPKKRNAFGRARLLFADPKLLPASASSAAATNPSFVVWNDGNVDQFFAQKVNASGIIQWAANGVVVSACSSGITEFLDLTTIISRSDGGCITIGLEARSPLRPVVAHRLDSAGAHQWAGTTGVNLYGGASATAENVACVSDGSDGAVAVWRDNRSGGRRVYARRIDSTGTPQWTVDGVEVSALADDEFPVITSDGAGGYYVGWRWYNGGTPATYAQRLNGAGAPQWAAGGISIITDRSFFDRPAMCLGSDGTLLVAAESSEGVLVVRKVSNAGATLWTTANLSPGSTNIQSKAIISDRAGGCVAVWLDDVGATFDIKALRVLSDGTPAWPAAVTLLTLGGLGADNERLQDFSIVEDGEGGMIVATDDLLASPSPGIIAQRVRNDGTLLWGAGVSVVSAPTQNGPRLTTDGASGCIVSWRNPTSPNSLFIRRIDKEGVLLWGAPTALFSGGAGLRALGDAAFTNAPDGSYPLEAGSGYHVWVGLDGTADERLSTGIGGTGIPWMIETPDHDLGIPDVDKDFDRIELYVKLGTGVLSAGLTLDSGVSAAVPLSVNFSGSRWGSAAGGIQADTLVWNQGKWAKSRGGTIPAPMPKGTIGSKYRMTLSSDLTAAFELSGYTLDVILLPDRRY